MFLMIIMLTKASPAQERFHHHMLYSLAGLRWQVYHQGSWRLGDHGRTWRLLTQLHFYLSEDRSRAELWRYEGLCDDYLCTGKRV